MHTQSSRRVRTPSGLAFPVHELIFVRAWAAGHGLTMHILLDRLLNGSECEEMLVLRGVAASSRTLTLWRQADGGIVAQGEGRAPRVFGGIHSALTHAGPLCASTARPKPRAWRRLLAWRHGLAASRLPGPIAHAMRASARWGIV